ncbi:aspartate dehydrogenase domain-containing protein-like [Ornithodoros turicata]|uniref:Aspartate dehydrogenase domain-containing protein n=1 Tax=Ornithodoros turicata TaxID=34597 RepID=A0A2R5LIM4_9ACAR
MRRRIGIVGFGHLGQFLAAEVQRRPDAFELAFVWSRGRVQGLPQHLVLEDLAQFASRRPDIVVEVAHPSISKAYGELFLRHADYLVGSPSALADPETELKLRSTARQGRHGLYVPSGALWGLHDIRAMADRGALAELTITMAKHPTSLKLVGADIKARNDAVVSRPTLLYEGPVRELCGMAPNNVNTMAAAALAAHNLGFDGVKGRLVADPALIDYHVVEVEAIGPTEEDGRTFRVHTVRRNPAARGVVTASATYDAFLSSLLAAHGKGPGVHLC